MIGLDRRRAMMGLLPTDIIINRKWSDNDAALMEVIYAQKWSKSPLYMTQREAEAVTDIGTAFKDNTKITSFNQFEYFTSVCVLNREAFQNCTSLISIVIPRNVTKIGVVSWSNSSFYGCTSLQYVSFAEGSRLQTLGGYVFYNSNIEYITLPDTVTNIHQAFRQCTKLKEIRIPPLVTSISNAGFLGCSSLSTVYLSSNVLSCDVNSFDAPSKDIYFKGTINDWCVNKYGYLRKNGFTLYVFDEAEQIYRKPTHITIENDVSEGYVFAGQKELQEVLIKDNVTNLGGAGAFNSCTNLENVTLGNGLTSIPVAAFDYCSKLKDVVFPNSLKTIGSANSNSGAFRGCKSFTKVEIPDSVELIGSFAFRDCTGIKSVVIGNGQLHICAMAFGACSSLETVDIGSGIYQIGVDCFWSCSKLKSIIIRALEPPVVDKNAVNDMLCPIYVPDESVEAYKAADIWSAIAGRIKPISELPQ